MRRVPRPTVAVVVVSYNTREILADCLATAIEQSQEVVVVDNGSTDGTPALVRARFPTVRLEIQPNRGYGAAANVGVRCSRSPIALVLNSDTLLHPGALTAMVDYFLEHPAAGMLGPRLVNLDGSFQRSAFPFPGVRDALVSETGVQLGLRAAPLLREQFLRTWSHDRARPVPWVLGAALALRRAAFDTANGFDEDLFMYGEEVDLARRLLDAGWETHFVPTATISHIGGASSPAQLSTYPARVEATCRFLAKYSHPHSLYGFIGVMRAALLARTIRDRVRLTRSSGARASLLADRLQVWKATGQVLPPVIR